MELNRSNLRKGKQNMHKEHAIGIPITQLEYALLPDPRNQYQLLPSPSKHYSNIRHSRIGSVFAKVAKIGEFANGIREHVRLGSKLSVTVKGKLSLGAKILQVGGVEQVFEQNFSIMHDEKLLKASQCYLSTTVGPIAGLLFVSNHRVAFSSERSIKVPSSTGKPLRAHYKVTIPLGKIKNH